MQINMYLIRELSRLCSRNTPSLMPDEAYPRSYEKRRKAKRSSSLAEENTRPSLWKAIQTFRRQFDLEELNVDEIYRDVRDRSAGRDDLRDTNVHEP